MLTKTTGIVLIVLGLIMMAYTGFNYITTEKVIEKSIEKPIKTNDQ